MGIRTDRPSQGNSKGATEPRYPFCSAIGSSFGEGPYEVRISAWQRSADTTEFERSRKEPASGQNASRARSGAAGNDSHQPDVS